jgi:hypothetical protein
MHRVAARRRGAGTRRPSAIGLPLVALVALIALAARVQAQAVPAGYEQGIFELRVARVATETVSGLLAPNGTVLVPIDRIIALTAVPARLTDSTVTVDRARGGGTATLALRSRRLIDAAGARALGVDELVRVDGTYYLATARVAELLGANVESDMGQLAVTLTRTPPFPAEQNAARAQRTASGAVGSDVPSAEDRVAFQPRSGGGVVDWSLSTVGSARALSGSTGTLRVATALYGGDLSTGAGLSGDGTGAARIGNAQWSYRRGIPENSYVRQFQVGDVVGGGALFRSLRGITFGNARPTSDPLFGSVPVDLNLPQGWQYEVYQDGHLLGFSDAGIRAPVYVPLRYGSTPVQVRLVSPTGDETVRDFSYLIPQSQQQPGRLEYSAGGGRCISGCESILFGDASYGARPWLSISGGAERRSIDGVARVYPGGGLSVASYSGWNAQLQAAAQSFKRASITYGGSGTVVGSASYARTYNGSGQPSVIADVSDTRWMFNGVAQFRTRGAQRISGWRIDNTFEGVEASHTERSRTALSADFARGTAGLSYETDRGRDLRELGISTLAVFAPNSRASSILGTLLFDARSVHALELSTSYQTGTRGAAALTTRWQNGSGVSLSVGYNGALGALRLTSRLSASTRQPAYVATTASGSAALDGLQQPTLFEGPGVGLSGVAGRVFYDMDGDNEFGVGDLPAPAIRVIVSGAQTRSDSAGRYHVWNVAPYETAEIAIDTLAFSDPSWTLQRPHSAMRATPGTFNRVDFPLVRTRELAGQLVADSTVATVGGVTLFLTPATGGAPQKIVTFSDGSFYLSRVRPGRYELTVSASALDVLHADASPASQSLQMIVSADEPVFTTVPIRLHGRPRTR